MLFFMSTKMLLNWEAEAELCFQKDCGEAKLASRFEALASAISVLSLSQVQTLVSPVGFCSKCNRSLFLCLSDVVEKGAHVRETAFSLFLSLLLVDLDRSKVEWRETMCLETTLLTTSLQQKLILFLNLYWSFSYVRKYLCRFTTPNLGLCDATCK